MKKYLAVLSIVLVLVIGVTWFTHAQQVPNGYSPQTRVAGYFAASNYNTWRTQIISGNSATGSQSITVGVPNAGPTPGLVTLTDGRVIAPFRVNERLLVGIGSNQETVTLTTVSNCPPAGPVNPVAQCTLTATFANTHGAAEPIFSGSFGLDEAVGDANSLGGGTITVDASFLGSTATITGATPFAKVWIRDERGPAPVLFGSNTGVTAYSASNNDIISSGATPFTKTFSQTYSVAPICFATGSAVTTVPFVTSTTTSATATCTGTCSLRCDPVK